MVKVVAFLDVDEVFVSEDFLVVVGKSFLVLGAFRVVAT